MKKSKVLSDYMNPTDKQRYAMEHLGTGAYIFWGGARGGGKTHFSLMAAVYCSRKFPGLRTVAIRETYPELEECFIENLQEKYPEDVFNYTYRDKTRTAKFKNGSSIIFRSCDNEDAARRIRGLEFQFMIIDEANNLDYKTIERLRGSLRRTKDMPFMPTLLMTGNPGGRSDLYFKTHYIYPDYKRWEKNELKYKDKYIFIPAKVYDNPYIGSEYIENLEGLSDDLRRAWLDGDWNIFEGQFFTMWDEKAHVVQRFAIPDDWERKASIDLGYTTRHPTCVYFAAQDPVYKTLYLYDEYVASGVPEQFAREIKSKMGDQPFTQFFADPSMFGDTKNRLMEISTAQIFRNEGIFLLPANNNRVDGWRVMKQWLYWGERQKPMLRVFENCTYFRETIPSLTYDRRHTTSGEDLDTKQADDPADCIRYLLLSGYGYPSRSEREISAMDAEREALLRETMKPEKVYDRYVSLKGAHGATEIEYSPLRTNTLHGETFATTRSYYG